MDIGRELARLGSPARRIRYRRKAIVLRALLWSAVVMDPIAIAVFAFLGDESNLRAAWWFFGILLLWIVGGLIVLETIVGREVRMLTRGEAVQGTVATAEVQRIQMTDADDPFGGRNQRSPRTSVGYGFPTSSGEQKGARDISGRLPRGFR